MLKGRLSYQHESRPLPAISLANELLEITYLSSNVPAINDDTAMLGSPHTASA
jgi:hypothetical protein